MLTGFTAQPLERQAKSPDDRSTSKVKVGPSHHFHRHNPLSLPLGVDPRLEVSFQGVTFDMARDENEACVLIRVRPSFQINRIMEHVLDDKRMSWSLQVSTTPLRRSRFAPWVRVSASSALQKASAGSGLSNVNTKDRISVPCRVTS